MLPKEGSRVTLEVYLKNPPIRFNSKVVACDSQSIAVSAPSFQGKKVGVPTNTRVVMRCPGANGVLNIETSMQSVSPKGGVSWVLPIPDLNGITHVDRRMDPRVQVNRAIAWKFGNGLSEQSEWMPSWLIDLHMGGGLLKVYNDLEVGQEVFLDLSSIVPDEEWGGVKKSLPIRGWVVRSAAKNRFGMRLEQTRGLQRVLLHKALNRLEREKYQPNA